jgi:hypothetical protein
LLPPPLLVHDTVIQNKDARTQQMTRLHKKRQKFSQNE